MGEPHRCRAARQEGELLEEARGGLSELKDMLVPQARHLAQDQEHRESEEDVL